MSGPNTNFDPKQVASLDVDAVEAMVADARAAFAAADDLDALKAARLAHAGDRSPLALANREIGALPPAAKADAGKRVGQARAAVKSARRTRGGSHAGAGCAGARVRSSRHHPAGGSCRRWRSTSAHHAHGTHGRCLHLHGCDIAEGPEAEAEWANFDALNVPPDHPARTMQDTFYVESADSGVVLRTQTSPIQIRAMLERPLPIYVVAPGRVYRTDELDATHAPVFTRSKAWRWTKA